MTTKAAHYLQQLDVARCEGNWDALPELIRKVRKHAPDRACLALTAETEHAIAIATSKQNSVPRPSTAVSAKELEASAQVPKLLEAIDAESTHVENKFQAQVCTGWLHWVVGEYNLAAIRLPKTLEPEFTQIDSFDNSSEWTKVCALKSAYLRANCLIRANQRGDALDIFEGALPPLSSTLANKPLGKQLRYWSELFLTEFSMNVSQAFEEGEKKLEDPSCLSSYRVWAKYWEGTTGQLLQGGYGFSGSVPRRRVWYDYYSALSSIIEEDLQFPTGNAPVSAESNAKSRLRVELKKVEAAYETLLLSETQFPRADEERGEVESFIHVVMRNWAIMAGRSWKEQDLGPGGRENLSRGVLDILYRTATKTYHSTAILRHLFTIHLAVAEFDLAFKAFDSYLDIVTKGKARVEKTGHDELNLDSDAQFLETVAQCITALCRYGDRAAAEKARDLGKELEVWVGKFSAPQPNRSIPDAISETGNGNLANSYQDVPSSVLSFAWQAIGMAQAQWSRMTYDSDARTEIQANAIRSLKRSLSPQYGCSSDTRSLFALSLLLAERRELSTAIEVVKAALMMNKPPPEERGVLSGAYLHERLLIPLWHLLALVMSARQDYVTAARFCEGALEQFKDPVILFGTSDLKDHFRSEHLNESEAKGERVHPPGLVDEMDDFERESILEVKMTQLSLVEMMEGPDVAVNASYELLSLFSRLFGSVETPSSMKPQKSIMPLPPKSSASTLRSIKGTIFGSRSEKRGRRPSFSRMGNNVNEKTSDGAQDRPLTMQTTTSALTTTPSIQITGENGLTPASAFRSRSSHGKRSESTRRGNSLRKRESSKKRAVSASGGPRRPTLVDGDAFFTPAEDPGSPGPGGEQAYDFFTFSSKRQASTVSIPPPIRSLSFLSTGGASNGGMSDASGGIAGATQLLPTTLLPVIQFSKEHDKRRRTTILIKVWLMIAGFYRRANMLNDCREAIGEAQKYTSLLEKEVSKDPSGDVSIAHSGWAGYKSVEQLHGDCWAELGKLALLKEQPYTARADFEAALTHFPDHPDAIIGLSKILLDLYSEKLLPDPAVQPLHLPGTSITSATTGVSLEKIEKPTSSGMSTTLPSGPLGLGGGIKPGEEHANNSKAVPSRPGLPPGDPRRNVLDMLNQSSPLSPQQQQTSASGVTFGGPGEAHLPPPYKAKSIPVVDRLAARDRAYGLLSGLTKLGAGWNHAEAWFALARAHEESGQEDKAKDVLWWCVELEEGTGVRGWGCVGCGGYVL
ncbi:uncharacterized protein MKZ38_006093 [Zalerion maritima]|uniref:Filamentation protein n=1 Tax=Zalerion maritima TaxID=339359 RepID=A0AAD5WUK5_9PEZI|nr:uncharacterized protein MKZ38_006093 [Zalerion maritima]